MSVAKSLASSIARQVAQLVAMADSGGGFGPLTGLALDGVSPSVAISAQYLGGTGDGQAWADARHPTLNVEKGYGSAIFQDLYPDPTTGELFTEPDGGGVSATTFAGGSSLFVQTPYNQALSGPLASGHPTPITDASRRVFLDLSAPTAPAFAGILTGTQDGSQHATERGYDLQFSSASNVGLMMLSLDSVQPTGTVAYTPIQGTSRNLLVQPANPRWYDSLAIAVATMSTTQMRLPSVKVSMQDEEGYATAGDWSYAVHGGAFYESTGGPTLNATAQAWKWLGTTNPLTGKAYACVIIANSYVTPMQMRYDGTLTKRLYKTCKAAFAADQLALMGPIPYQLFPMDLGTGLANIRIVCTSGAGRAIEASYAGSAYQTIGTTDENGYLVGTFVGAVKGTATLNVRVVGQATVYSVANVRVGIYCAMLGQSNAIGRGDDVTLTAARTNISNAIANSTATQKSWIWAFAQDLATEYACPIAMGGWAAGSAYLYFNAAGSTDGRHGHFNVTNPGSSTVDEFSKASAHFLLGQESPNFAIWHQGESESSSGDGHQLAKYKPALVAMWEGLQSRASITTKLHVMQIGRNGNVADAQVDEMRETLLQCCIDRPDLFEFGGCLAHLPVEDALDAGQNVHFYTVAQKANVVDVFKRHALGSGRGPQYSSMVASGTTITITCTGGVSPLTISGGEAVSPIGWTVTDGGGSNVVTAVSVSGLVITLTVTSTLTGTATVKWLSHYTGIGTTLLDSDATTPVPPEPFSESVAAT